MSEEVQGAMGEWARDLADEELDSLCVRAQAGDHDAITEAMEVLAPRVRAMRRRYEGQLAADSALTADDIAQEAWLHAIIAVKRWAERGYPAGVYVSLRIRGHLRPWLKRAGDKHFSVMSLNQPTADDGEPVGEIFFGHQNDGMDTEMEELIGRLPPGARAADEDYLTLRLRQAIHDPLPDDKTLANLVRQGKTMDELTTMFGAAKRTIQNRVAAVRRSGVSVPRGKRGRITPPSSMQKVPWAEKVRIITAYLDSHPGASIANAKKDLGVGFVAMKKAMTEIAQRSSGHD